MCRFSNKSVYAYKTDDNVSIITIYKNGDKIYTGSIPSYQTSQDFFNQFVLEYSTPTAHKDYDTLCEYNTLSSLKSCFDPFITQSLTICLEKTPPTEKYGINYFILMDRKRLTHELLSMLYDMLNKWTATQLGGDRKIMLQFPNYATIPPATRIIYQHKPNIINL